MQGKQQADGVVGHKVLIRLMNHVYLASSSYRTSVIPNRVVWPCSVLEYPTRDATAAIATDARSSHVVHKEYFVQSFRQSGIISGAVPLDLPRKLFPRNIH